MTRIPEPDQTPRGPAYQGRLLDRATEEVVDQGVAFDVRTLISRRGVLSLLGVGASTLVLAACTTGTSGAGASATASGDATSTPSATASTGGATSAATEIPDETAGPYPGDGSNGVDVLNRSGIVRSDLRSSIGGGATAAGVPMTLTLTILDMANDDAPFTGVAVYVWHCDAGGNYSMYSSGVENETYLRGVQVADSGGSVTFTSIYPACYPGRWPHIHFEVYPTIDGIADASNAIATSQVAMPESTSNTVYALSDYSGSASNMAQVSLTTDNVFSDDQGVSQTPTVTGDTTSGYRVALTAYVDTRTTPTAGSSPAGRSPGSR